MADVLNLPDCNFKWLIAGGRDERVCGETVFDEESVCAACGKARCQEHEHTEFFEEIRGKFYCEDCAPDQPAVGELVVR